MGDFGEDKRKRSRCQRFSKEEEVRRRRSLQFPCWSSFFWEGSGDAAEIFFIKEKDDLILVGGPQTYSYWGPACTREDTATTLCCTICCHTFQSILSNQGGGSPASWRILLADNLSKIVQTVNQWSHCIKKTCTINKKQGLLQGLQVDLRLVLQWDLQQGLHSSRVFS